MSCEFGLRNPNIVCSVIYLAQSDAEHGLQLCNGSAGLEREVLALALRLPVRLLPLARRCPRRCDGRAPLRGRLATPVRAQRSAHTV